MTYYSTDIPQTAVELFDGELVIANYDSGLYYSISAGGAVVWQGLRHGLDLDAVVGWLADAYPAEADLPQRTAALVARLLGEGLLIPIANPTAGPPLPDLPATLGPMNVERFEDLQELLLLDPVHDVDEAGWPRRAEDDASN